MGKNLQINLQIDENKSSEAIKYLQFELDKLNKYKPIMEGEILINTTHTIEKKDYIRIGFYVRNATNQKIALNQIPVKFLSQNGSINHTKAFKLDKPIVVHPYKAAPYTIAIEKKCDNTKYLKITVDSRLGLINELIDRQQKN